MSDPTDQMMTAVRLAAEVQQAVRHGDGVEGFGTAVEMATFANDSAERFKVGLVELLNGEIYPVARMLSNVEHPGAGEVLRAASEWLLEAAVKLESDAVSFR